MAKLYNECDWGTGNANITKKLEEQEKTINTLKVRVIEMESTRKEVETLKQDMIAMQRKFYRVTHNRVTDVRATPDLPKELSDEETDREMEKEEKDFNLLRKADYTAKIQDGKFVRSSPK